MDAITMFGILVILVCVFWFGLRLREMEQMIKTQRICLEEYKSIFATNNNPKKEEKEFDSSDL